MTIRIASRLKPALLGAVSLGLVLTACSSGDDALETSTGTSSSSVASSETSETTSSSSTSVSLTDLAPTTSTPAPPSPVATTPTTPVAQPPRTTVAPTTRRTPPPGNINQTVAPVPQTTKAPVPASATVDYGNGVTVTIPGFESIRTTAEGPGEIAGPGVKITVKITNGTAAAIDLSAVIVDLADSSPNQSPAIGMTTSPAAPFTGSLAPGQSANGVYVFTYPQDWVTPAVISVTYAADQPIVVFTR
jgi:hypothetical protein